MRYCIPISADRDFESPVHGHFGSAPYFAVVDPGFPRLMEIVRNENANHEHGKCNPVAAIAELEIGAVVVNGIGSRALQRFQESGIAVYRCQAGTVRIIADAIAANSLVTMSAEQSCQGHGDTGCNE